MSSAFLTPYVVIDYHRQAKREPLTQKFCHWVAPKIFTDAFRPRVYKSFFIHFNDIDVLGCQIVNTPSKARKDFYSRIERFNVF
ncbi:hypothetical protein CBP27_06575 [Fischerella thermalis WC542]|nr:hypothetical protein CBP19_19380 [Fischerella thermalis WC1110]PLZ15697.1 hypothetical protein CBP17_01255 [Fischerella thermalis WC114]PLZ20795.1 hypothetical protein CBP29_16435 [Fischerella thermalis WC341]PLZ24220.1 hypothetical protein CBP30_02015 [Fischerella thermalis WC157]PLZ32570.1 hypothetical protein CBP28_04835 [Fischerella thermalis WC559]PLZ34294.1 hypothetical protein CBP10_06155 [Fischerella thermalis WC558]PLZ36705.1 hypothetical protein CBP26_20730 [Fischerella thermalis